MSQIDKANSEAALAKENRTIQARLAEAGAHGRDQKHLGEDVEVARVEAAERSALDKQLAQDQLASENRVLRQRLGVQVGKDKKKLEQDIEDARRAAGSTSHDKSLDFVCQAPGAAVV